MVSLVPLSILCWFGMNNLGRVAEYRRHDCHMLKITWLYTLWFVPAIVGMYLYLPANRAWSAEHVGGDRANHYQHSVHAETDGLRHDERRCRQAVRNFRNKHWSMTLLYIVTFGSFVAFHGIARAVDQSDLRRQPRARRGWCNATR